MILIADSGSTKTHWCVLHHGQMFRQVFTKGINPVFQTQEEVEHEITTALIPQVGVRSFNEVHFFGAGCLPEKTPVISEVFSSLFDISGQIEVDTDMLGAAKGLAGCNPGIICILGTGSNSCFYDGKHITENVPALGFILGDEGSGAVLGRLLVGDLLKNQLGKELKELFFQTHNLTPTDIIDRVYRRPFPNRFLASLSPFLKAHLDNPRILELVRGSFKSFLSRNVMQYDYRHHPVHFTGSVAYHYKEILLDVAKEAGVEIGSIIQAPMDGLKVYYSKKEIWHL